MPVTLALGLMAAAAVAVILTGGDGRLAGLEARAGSFELDNVSLVVGIALGVLLTLVARIWLAFPRRAIAWLLDHERAFYRLGWAVLCLAVLLFY